VKSFNKLIGVFVVSATVLLTGCNIEALGNFGKATATFKEFAPITKSAYEMCLLGKELEYHKAIV